MRSNHRDIRDKICRGSVARGEGAVAARRPQREAGFSSCVHSFSSLLWHLLVVHGFLQGTWNALRNKAG